MTVASLPNPDGTGHPHQHQQHLSTEAVQTVVLAAVSCILYVRCVLPEDHFVPMTYDNLAFKVLREKCSEVSTLLYDMLDYGVYDAIQHQYLRKLTISIIKSPDHRDQCLESYHLHFSYPRPGSFSADAELVHSGNTSHHYKLGHFDSCTDDSSSLKMSLSQQVHEFIFSLTSVLQTLKSLPANCSMDMHLEFNDSAPQDYEPMFFRSSEIVPHVPSPVKMSSADAVMETRWHRVKLECEMTAIGIVRQSSQPLSSPIRNDVAHHLVQAHTSTQPNIAQPHDAFDSDAVPHLPNSDDTILDDPEYEDNQHLRAARRVSQQPCETTAAAEYVCDFDDSSTQAQWPTQTATVEAAHTDSGTQLDSESHFHPPMLTAVTAPDPTTMVITLSSSDDPAPAPPASSRSPPASSLPLTSNTVDCLCQLNDSDGGMLQCDACHAWMHVVCYGYLYVKDPRLPERFLCVKCDVGSDKFKGVSKSERQELGMFRSAVSVIWNEVPVVIGGQKGSAASHLRSRSKAKGVDKKMDEHVWRDKQLAARLFITVDQANHLLARAVDERIASWQARGKYSKGSQILAVVHKQSNDARRALHVLFNPNLTRLPPRGKGTLVALESALAPATARTGASASRPAAAAAAAAATARDTSKQVARTAGKEQIEQMAAAATVSGPQGYQGQMLTGSQAYLLSPAGSQTQVYSQTQLDSMPMSPPTHHHHHHHNARRVPSLAQSLCSDLSAGGSQTQVCSPTQLDTFPLGPSTIHQHQHQHQHPSHTGVGSQTQLFSQAHLDTFPLSPSPHHPSLSSLTPQPPPATTGTVIPASMTPPATLSKMYATQTLTGLRIHSAAASGHSHSQYAGMMSPASSLDLLRVTNHTQHVAGLPTAPAEPHSASPLLLMTHTTPAATSRSGAAAPGTVFGSQSTCASLYQMHHHRPTYAHAHAPAAMTMTPPESSGTLRWMPDSQMQPLTDGSIELGSGHVLTRPGVWVDASPVMVVDEGQYGKRGGMGKRKYASSGVTVNGEVDGWQGDDEQGAGRSKKAKQSAARQRAAKVPIP